MLKECYYKDQTDFEPMDYAYLHRFIDRMIQYRYSHRGSYDDGERIDEIKRIDLNRLSYNTKLILLYCIHRHEAQELFLLPNLQPLENTPYRDIHFLLEEKKDNMKLSIDDFLNNIKELNEMIKEDISSKKLPDDFIFEIRCIGGFAMSYYNLREAGVTENMDSLIEINSIVKESIKQIAEEREIAVDWINDTMIQFYSDASSFHWQEVPWFLGKNTRIKVYVCSKEDLLKNKIGLAERYLQGESTQDRDAEIDFRDTLALLRSFDIYTGVNPAFAGVILEDMGINPEDYLSVFEGILDKDYRRDEDYYLFRMMSDVDRGKKSYDGFIELLDRLGLSAEEVRTVYSMYIQRFPKFYESFFRH